MDISFYVLPELACDLVLGMPWLTKANPTINWNSFEVSFDIDSRKYFISGLPKFSHSLASVEVSGMSAK